MVQINTWQNLIGGRRLSDLQGQKRRRTEQGRQGQNQYSKSNQRTCWRVRNGVVTIRQGRTGLLWLKCSLGRSNRWKWQSQIRWVWKRGMVESSTSAREQKSRSWHLPCCRASQPIKITNCVRCTNAVESIFVWEWWVPAGFTQKTGILSSRLLKPYIKYIICFWQTRNRITAHYIIIPSGYSARSVR